MAEGVFMQDLIDFCRCDRMLILRFPKVIERRQSAKPTYVASSEFTPEESRIVSTLASGDRIPFSEAFETIFKVAHSQIGKPYDFRFLFSNYNNLSCTEFVYFCIKSLEWFHGLSPKKRRFLILDKEVLEPDAFVESILDLVWQSRSIDQKKIAEMRKDKEISSANC